ncbi:MAG: hypothetical protein OXC29_18920, partial [Rhodococcus sp.]|nr:hypothetical protein [Rhodococcus sp. (in: high G+C Gram-positive bacteria)]
MTALAVLVALVGAMFVSLQSASAAALGDCSATETNYLAIGDTCTIDAGAEEVLTHAATSDKRIAELSDASTGSYGEDDDANVFTAAGAVTVTAKALGTITITDTNNDAATADPTPSNDATFKIEVIPAPTLEVIFDDSDATVEAGTEVEVGIRIKAVGADSDAVAVILKAPSGLYFLETGGNDDATDDTTPLVAPASVNGGPTMTEAYATRKLQTAGAPNGDYEVTATLAADVGSLKKGDYTKTLVIGEPGAGLDSVELTLDINQKDNNPVNTEVDLVATAKNAGGANANPGDVTSILVNATGGSIIFSTCGAEAAQREKSNFAQLVEDTTGDNVGRADTNCDGTVGTADSGDAGLGAVTKFSVQRATAGTVTVQVTVIGGAAGTKTSNELVLVFAGGADAITVGSASDNLAQKGDEITFEVTATDKGGRTADVYATAITVALKDADGATPKNLTVSDAQKFTDTNANGEKDGVEKDVDTAVIVTVQSDANNKAAAGHYTVEVTLNNNANTKQTATFTVVGAAEEITVDVDMSVIELGDVITVTATIRDAEGNLIADDKTTEPMVEFASAGALELSGFGAVDGIVKKPAKDGVASAKFVATKGSGKAVILVDHGAATGTATVSTDPPTPEVEEEPEIVEPEPEPEPAAATLASASASVSADSANVGDSVDVTITATDSADATADDSLVAAVILTANGTLVSADAVGSQPVSVSCDEPGSIEISVRLVGTDTMVHEASAS